jgi:5-methylcytosine-specific restriction endonuclease McrA
MINSSVLVLNRSFQPVHVTTVKRAFTLLYLGVARALDREMSMFDFETWTALTIAAGDDVIHTSSRQIKVPRVIVLQLYDRIPRTKVRFSRLNIYARDNNTCQYCGRHLPRAQLNLDHIVPRAQGGRTTWENVCCCCVQCNLRKGARTPEQAGMVLTRAATRPRWTPVFRTPEGRVAYREWLPFLGLVDAAYWNTELLDDD